MLLGEAFFFRSGVDGVTIAACGTLSSPSESCVTICVGGAILDLASPSATFVINSASDQTMVVAVAAFLVFLMTILGFVPSGATVAPNAVTAAAACSLVCDCSFMAKQIVWPWD